MAVAYRGFQVGTGILRWVFAIGAPIVVAVIWGVLLAPKSQMRLPYPQLMMLKIILFGLGTVVLWLAGQRLLALVFAGVVILNLSLTHIWKQDAPMLEA